MGSDARFTVTYQITAQSFDEANAFAEKIAVEQTVEMPIRSVPESAKSYLAEVLKVEEVEEARWFTHISYPYSAVGDNPTQLLNVLYGNVSLLDAVKVIDCEDNILCSLYNGPAFGIPGIRQKLHIENRPLSCTTLKPMGLTPSELAKRAYHFTRGGIDIIKDDHGLVDQESAGFRSRVQACVRAVRKGEQVSGKRTFYFPNITTSPSGVFDRFKEAVDLGADGVLISPQLSGLDIVSDLAGLREFPVMAHPAFSGSFVVNSNHGFSPELYYGKLWRALGADAVIYPNAGGRFNFTVETCKNLNHQMRTEFCQFNPSFPTPAGGIDIDSLSEWKNLYGSDTLFLIGGSLYEQQDGLEETALKFQKTLQS